MLWHNWRKPTVMGGENVVIPEKGVPAINFSNFKVRLSNALNYISEKCLMHLLKTLFSSNSQIAMITVLLE